MERIGLDPLSRRKVFLRKRTAFNDDQYIFQREDDLFLCYSIRPMDGYVRTSAFDWGPPVIYVGWESFKTGLHLYYGDRKDALNEWKLFVTFCMKRNWLEEGF